MDNIDENMNKEDSIFIPTTIEETIVAPPPSPTSSSSSSSISSGTTSNNNMNDTTDNHNTLPAVSESESKIHLVAGDELVNKNTFNEIENELVQLNLSSQKMAITEHMDVTCIKETMKMDIEQQNQETNSNCSQDDENRPEDVMEEIPLNEEPDTLSPLLIDNHTHVQHQEMLVNGHYYNPRDEQTIRTLNPLARSFMRQQESFESISDSVSSVSSIGTTSTPLVGPKLINASTLTISNIGALNNNNNNNDMMLTYSSDEGKDSGRNQQLSDEFDGPYEVPDDETCYKITEQVEFYFSNESLLKDAFLLKHVRRNKEGFVSLKLVSSFKRVRQLCKDWRAVGHAIKKASKRIELNELGTKIRRLDPLPDYDETLPSRTIVATGFPFDKLTIEKVSDIFSKCGEIALVRILRPGGQIPGDVRQFMNKHPKLLENECALVEFTESSSARIAQQMEGLCVLELVLPKKKTGKKANVTKLVESLKYSSESDNERNRGGTDINNRFQLKRNNSAFYMKPEQNTYIPPPRRMSFGNEPTNAFEHFQNKRFNNMQTLQNNFQNNNNMQQPEPMRRHSGCSDSYGSSCNEMSRRSSMCSNEMSRRYSNCSDSVPSSSPQQHQQVFRRYSNCSDFCTCSHRRASHSSISSDVNSRKYSAGSNFSTGSAGFERRFSNASDIRRTSIDSIGYERRISSGSMNGYEPHSPHKCSNGFDPFRKLSNNSDQYYMNGRRISTDSGYDRRMSFGSDISGVQQQHQQNIPTSPIMNRHRSGSLFKNENVVRTPIGPDGSKGFARARRFGQVIPPV